MKLTALTRNICSYFNVKTISEKEFLSLAPWDDYKLKKNKPWVQVDDDFKLHFDSEDEKVIYEHIVRNDLAKIIRGQALKIPIPNTSNHYYPDIIYLDQNNEVVIIEVKSKANMSTVDVLKRYRALRVYAKEHGFHYTIIDKHYTSMKSLCKMNYHKGLETKIIKHIETHGLLDSQAVTKIRNEHFPHIKRKVLDKMITAIIIQNRYIDKKVNQTQLHVINKKHKIYKICSCGEYEKKK